MVEERSLRSRIHDDHHLSSNVELMKKIVHVIGLFYHLLNVYQTELLDLKL